MRRFLAPFCTPTILLSLLSAPASSGHDDARSASNQPPEDPRWCYLHQEARINELLWSLSTQHRPRPLAITGVSLLLRGSSELIADRTLVARDGLIAAIGPTNEVVVPGDALRVDARGTFVIPGLVDSHVHTLVSNSHYLLCLANGVTTVREMCGYDWMLRIREQVRDNRFLAPNLLVAGTILNAFPMGMYAVVVKDAEHGRRLVREQHRAGYDFIKIHNRMPLERYSAILEEAQTLGIDVVGHIPHEVRIAQAIERGQRTFEHFKGYYLDRSIEMTDEDYVAVTRGADVWNCPTLYTRRIGLRGDEARAVLSEPEMQYVPAQDRAAWLALADTAEERVHQRVYDLSSSILPKLHAIGARFLAGTDSGGGYPFMVPGFALHEELELLVRNGLTPYDTLKAATVNAAVAARRSAVFGTLEVGKRADLVLLSKNPLASVSNLSAIDGVCVRGVWLNRAALDDILRRIRAIYADETIAGSEPSEADIDRLVASVADLENRGFIHMGHFLEQLRDAALSAGRTADPIQRILATRRPATTR
jgi:imidazolonepropionase-like amidohydrolase